MKSLRKQAQQAKVMLGDTGLVQRVAALATVYLDDDDWIVESLDSSGDGGICITAFSGPFAQERAIEYAQEKHSGLRLYEPNQP
jgi:hypothetical protein